MKLILHDKVSSKNKTLRIVNEDLFNKPLERAKSIEHFALTIGISLILIVCAI